MIRGATGSGKTTALTHRFHDWVRAGFRTDEILVLTAFGAHSGQWRAGVDLEAHGPLEAFTFFGFVQRELNLFWATVQAAEPALRDRVRPDFLPADVSRSLLLGLLEPLEAEFAAVVVSPPQRIAGQVAGALAGAAAAGISVGEMVMRLAAADAAPVKAHVYTRMEAVLEAYRRDCLQAGLLDYGLALQLFTGVLMKHPPYLDHLRRRYRGLLVDDLDEKVPAEQAFLVALAGQMERTVVAFGTDGGHSAGPGADPVGAVTHFGDWQVQELSGSHTCEPDMFAFGEAVAGRVLGRQPGRRFPGIVAAHVATELHSEMVALVLGHVEALLDAGVPPGEIALLTPYPDRILELTARSLLGDTPVEALNLTGRLLDDPLVHAVSVLAGLAMTPASATGGPPVGALARALQVLLRLDPVRASRLAEAIRQAGGHLPGPAELQPPLRPDPARRYARLRDWVEGARERAVQQAWAGDEFVQAAVVEVLAPLIGNLGPEQLYACQQYQRSAQRYRIALERLGRPAFGNHYQPMVTEGTGPYLPPGARDVGRRDAVIIATPQACLQRRLTSRYQIWCDISSPGWYRSGARELFNPHALQGDVGPWNYQLEEEARQQAAARTVRALLRRCTGKVILAESSLGAGGMEQDGGLAEAFADLVPGQGVSR